MSKKQSKIQTAFIMREVFSIIGFIFVLLFTIRGIWQFIYTLLNHYKEITSLLSCNDPWKNWLIILESLKKSHSPILDILFKILINLLYIHVILGIYYAASTNYKMKNMFKEKSGFFLQIISAFAAALIISGLVKHVSIVKMHFSYLLIGMFSIAAAAAYHIANGFYNACISLGIIVSQGSKKAAKILTSIISVISMLQIVILFL